MLLTYVGVVSSGGGGRKVSKKGINVATAKKNNTYLLYIKSVVNQSQILNAVKDRVKQMEPLEQCT